MNRFQFSLRKMKTTLAEPVEYHLESSEGEVSINSWIGQEVKISFSGEINCLQCNKSLQKTYAGGYCFNCMQSLPQCDMCMVKPELCHYDRGTCRDPKWGEENCFQSHSVYLAKSSGVKVGITRENPTSRRWMDQGAIEGMVIAEVPDRKTSGLLEVALAKHIRDKTDFRKMLRGDTSNGSIEEVYQQIKDFVPESLRQHLLEERELLHIHYPLKRHPTKIKTFSLDKVPSFSSLLVGIKGQYLIFEEEVFNVRSHSGYTVNIEVCESDKEIPEEEEEPMSLFDLMG